MQERESKPLGLTASAGYQIGVRRTIAAAQESLWEFLFSSEGLPLWLGDLEELEPAVGCRYATLDGITGELRVVKPIEQVRLTWKPRGWPSASTLQVRLIPASRGITVSFHQEKLTDASMRDEMKERWVRALNGIEARLQGE